MKLYFIALLLCGTFLQAQNITQAGKWLGDDEQKNNPYILETDDYTKMMTDFVALYNAKDYDQLIAYYTDAYVEKNGENIKKSLDNYANVEWEPFVVIPVRVKGKENTQVLVWSNESREWKNGSKQKLGLVEVFDFTPERKINWVGQWRWNNPENEFGLPYGGKFFGKKENDYRGRPLVFSNRGETKAIEDFVAAYNKMDAEACALLFADNLTMEQADGKKVKMEKSDLADYFSTMKSVNWQLYSIVPLKIANTDPASGVMVSSRETRNMKDGSVWDKELVEYFYFNVEGKVNYIVQYARDISE